MKTYTLQQLSDYTGCTIVGDGEIEISSLASLSHAKQGCISFIANPKFLSDLPNTQASAVILQSKFQDQSPTAVVLSENPYATYAYIAQLLHPFLPDFTPFIHPSAVIEPCAQIHAGAYIGPNVYIGKKVTIADSVYIGPNSVIEDNVIINEFSYLKAQVYIGSTSIVGKRAIIQPGAVIGGDGFGYAQENAQWIKIPQLGKVILGDDVEIGANTTIDRATLENTVIGNGVKLDNLIQIGHNVHIGEHTAIAGCAGISGSTIIGKRCILAGGVGLVGHINITDDVQITGMSLVTKSITQPGVYASGTTAEAYNDWRKNAARFRQLDDIARRLYQLEKRMEKK